MALSIVVVWLVRGMAREAAGLGLLEVEAARAVAESVAHRHRPRVVEVAPAQRADLAAVHAGRERKLYGHAIHRFLRSSY